MTCEPGARSAWHTHPLGQTLIVTAGCGWTQCEGDPIVEIRAGDVIWCPPRHKHWHGATPATSMTHIAVRLQTLRRLSRKAPRRPAGPSNARGSRLPPGACPDTAFLRHRVQKRTVVGVRFWPIPLKSSLRAFPATIVGVLNHRLTNLRGTECVLKGRLFSGHSARALHMSFSTE